MEKLKALLRDFVPGCEQEERDRALILDWLERAKDPLERTNEVAHLTASAWIVNRDRTKVLMVWHNIYRSWSWTGGHADGETDLLALAVRQAREETGVTPVPVSPALFSVETLTVDGHEKRGRYVPSHLHMNLTWLMEADDTLPLSVKPDENSGVRWIPAEEVGNCVAEPWMMRRVYRKLIDRTEALGI